MKIRNVVLGIAQFKRALKKLPTSSSHTALPGTVFSHFSFISSLVGKSHFRNILPIFVHLLYFGAHVLGQPGRGIAMLA